MEIPSPSIQHPLPEEELVALRTRFLSLSGNDAGKWAEIEGFYGEETRAYHNLSHIQSMLRALDALPVPDEKQIMEWAVWYHDIIYDSRRKDNELKSAELFLSRHPDLPATDRQDVYDIILSTQKHKPLGNSPLTKYVLDTDLLILASSPDVYQQYAAAVREEYAWVPGILYRRGRKKVLHSFLERERIYFSDFFYKNFEKQARNNIFDEIKNNN